MKDNLLQVGDELYNTYTYGRSIEYSGIVDRVTKTMAFIGNTKLQRRYRSYTKEIGSSTWSKRLYYLMTEEKRKEIQHNKFRNKHSNVILKWTSNNIHEAIHQLSDDDLVAISTVLHNPTKK